jgi:hypothetical protein
MFGRIFATRTGIHFAGKCYAPIDGDASASVGTDRVERISISGQETPRGFGLVLIVDADQPKPILFFQRHKLRVLLNARSAPRGPDVHQRDLAAGQIRA